MTLQYDDDNDSYRIKEMNNVCQYHTQVFTELGQGLLYDKLLEENQRKNIVYDSFVNEIKGLTEISTLDDGSKIKALKRNIRFDYSFTGNALDTKGRDLEVEFKDVNTQRKIKIENIDLTKVKNRIGNKGIDNAKVKVRTG
jgi:hypothetical protein